ncbi:centrosomal protein of 104 kDa isoform X1 [Gambusia affinis]|uniref:centrosomal protein of 104 kDa isoform X1 n=1 Tax=Gambusia affinis TaxID=33528 RepID=UPI001CDB4D3A|nr:centrosomal protein of 104 kDa isoform X1 [Gambusia affinis]XP_043973170.1 centrosomal protein of 104 kDa isoform X1 [Gambusia affinis]
MPKKTEFTAVTSSSHEDNFSAKELMVHAPTVSGWRSSRMCSYPQHLTLQLAERCRIRKLQLLAHQYMIPAKVEFHVGDSLPEASLPGFPGQFHRLGYVSLSDNEKTGFKARELKSVHVDAVGTYLRITLHRNHANRYNRYNQVALVAINVLGDPVDGVTHHTGPSRDQLIELYLNSTQQEAALDTTFMGKCLAISQFDDLAFDMYQDPEVAHIIRLLDQKKQEVVRQENFEEAKKLKQAIADLQKVGERLARYDVEKKCAIEKENYDLAKTKKELMDEYRKSVYQQLEVHNLLDMTMMTKTSNVSSAQCPPPLLPSPADGSASTKPLLSTDDIRKGKKLNAHNQQTATQTVVPKPSSQPDKSVTPASLPTVNIAGVPYDERPLPALQRKDRAAESIQTPPAGNSPKSDVLRSPPGPDLSGEPEPLTEKALREAGLPIEAFGESLVAGAYSKTWCYREDALLTVHNKLLEVSATAPKDELRNTIRAAVFLVKKALLDKVSSVFHASLKLLRLMLSQLIPSLGLGRVEVTHCLEQTLPNLLVRTGDSPNRLRTAAIALIQEIAVLKEVRASQIIPSELVKPFKSNFPPRLAQSRAELLEKLLVELGTDNSGFTLENVIMFCTAALEHSAKAVRELAVSIILSLYEQHRGAVLSYLPPNDASTQKNFLYKTLFDGFGTIDGKIAEPQALKNDVRQQPGQQEKKEIRFLQKQLAALKDITERESESGTDERSKQEQDKVDKQSPKGVTKGPQCQTTDCVDIQEAIEYLDNMCIFCGKKDESFTEDGLDLHYWKQCLMLQRCDECRQVVEIASLTEHLLRECENRSKFSQCPRCSEAVPTEELAGHVQSSNCNRTVAASNHCPLCHNNFPPGEEAWKTHLMGQEGCKQNSRRTAVSQRTQPAQGRAAGGIKPLSLVRAGARTRTGPGGGRGSRIPSLTPMARRNAAGKR